MRVPLIDPVKAIAAQLIVWHHMMLYSSMRGPLEEAFPTVVGFLANEAKYVVQVFLTIGGFLAAQSFEKYLTGSHALPAKAFTSLSFIESLANRYTRLVKPFGLAMLIAALTIGLTLKIAPATDLDPVHWRQFLAHLFLLHDVFGFDAISAGAWYVAIDFQLFLLFGLIVLISQKIQGVVRVPMLVSATFLTLALTLIALFNFNLEPEMEIWALYFFGSYGVGIIAHRAVVMKEKALGFALILTLIGVANMIDFRERLWVAAATAVFLLIAPTLQTLPRWMQSRCVVFFNQSSYPLFLIHYPAAIVMFAALNTLELESTEQFVFAALSCYGLCLIAAKGLMNAVQVYETFEATVIANIQSGLSLLAKKVFSGTA